MYPGPVINRDRRYSLLRTTPPLVWSLPQNPGIQVLHRYGGFPSFADYMSIYGCIRELQQWSCVMCVKVLKSQSFIYCVIGVAGVKYDLEIADGIYDLAAACFNP